MVRIRRCIQQALPYILAVACVGVAPCRAQHFLPDDPMTRVPEVATVGGTPVQSINQLYDFGYHSFHYKSPGPSKSLGVNTLGEVPDSSWFTDRDTGHLSLEDVKKGARTHGVPQPPYTVVGAKTEGVTPGFRIKDARGLLYFVKVDPQSNPEMATAADVVGALFLYAAGFNVPENYILVARREQFHLSDKAMFMTASGEKHRMTETQLDKIFERIPHQSDGSIRAMASLSLPPKIMGPFRYSGVRSDDPNDIIPHEERGDLRGLAVIFGWLNHTDAKGDNSMDIVQGKGENARFVHYLLDFGDSFGSDSDIAKDPRHGQEFILPVSGNQLRRIYTLGLVTNSWETAHYPHDLKAVGNFTAQGFNPLTWKPNYPNPAFLDMTPLDAYWGAKRVMAFTNEQIRAIVEEGQFHDPNVVDYMTKVLEQRRDAIGRAWFGQVLPLEDFRITSDGLSFNNLAVQHGFSPPSAYQLSWFQWLNDEQKPGELHAADLGPSGSAALPGTLTSLAAGSYIGCKIVSEHQDGRSVTVYFRNEGDHWKLVGISRTTADGVSS
jgi:hypothetical protein